MIYITKHALEQYKKRISNTDNLDKQVYLKVINQILSDARYISDNANGILLRNEDLSIEMIVKRRKLITIYPIKKR
jgi:hypothetical protein